MKWLKYTWFSLKDMHEILKLEPIVFKCTKENTNHLIKNPYYMYIHIFQSVKELCWAHVYC